MSRNVGSVERAVRTVLGIGLLLIVTLSTLSTAWTIGLSIVGGIALVTGVIGFCPAWAALDVNTCEIQDHRKAT